MELSAFLKQGKQFRILYVEDEEISRLPMGMILSEVFGHVFIAGDGMEGLEIYRQNSHEIDVVITDINMPNMNGIQMLQEILEENPELYTVIITAHNEVRYLQQAIDLHVDAFINKPVVDAHLFSALGKCIKTLIIRAEHEQYKINLEQMVRDEVEKNRQKDELMLQQSKMAAMGTMIDAVGHQWNTPLVIIDMHVQMVDLYLMENGKENDSILDNVRHIKEQVTHMSNTLREFRGFFRPVTKRETISYRRLIESALFLMKDELVKHKIKTEVFNESDGTFLGNPNELKHVIINIINNAKDAFKEKEIKERKLLFVTEKSDKKELLYIQDNAGGIPENVIDIIFESNVTTKEEGKGSGLGLHLSTIIMQKHEGTLSVKNKDQGACFTLTLPAS